jgi:catalase (peroxidase I)
MSKNNRITMSFDEWAEQTVTPLIVETINILKHEENTLGIKGKNELLAFFLTGYVGSIMYNALMTHKDVKLSKEAKHQLVMKEFADTKAKMSEAMAQAFTAAMSNFVGRHIDYYCLVKPVPEAINKEPC